MSEAIGHDVEHAVANKSESGSGSRNRDVALRLLAFEGRPTTLVPLPDAPSEDDDTELIADGVLAPPSEVEVPPRKRLQALIAERGLDDPDLRLRELIEVERMRDLEIARLEAELAEKNDAIFDLQTALFHAIRRGDDLDRRWNELAVTYEQTASRLVEAGGRLEAIESQAGYRVILRLTGFLRRRPVMYTTLRRFARRVLFGATD